MFSSLGLLGASGSLRGLLPYLRPAWILWIVAGLALNSVVSYKSYLPRVIVGIMEYGKLRTSLNAGTRLDLTLPKRWFSHFYIWGSVWILSVTLVFIHSCFLEELLQFPRLPVLDEAVSLVTGGFLHRHCPAAPMQQEHLDTAVVLSMLSLQVARRLYESLFVSVFSKSRIHVLHYVLGMLFYPAVALTALLHLDTAGREGRTDSSPVLGVALFLRWYHILAVCLFLWASYHQHLCHKILASLRRGRGTGKNRGQASTEDYHRPDGDWFELVSCPHFFAEILIYVAMLLCCVVTDVGSTWWLVVVYVVFTLGLSARQTHTWYHRKYEDYPKHRSAIIPWVW